MLYAWHRAWDRCNARLRGPLACTTLCKMADESMASFARARPWWGEVVVPSNAQARWRLGPLTVWLQRLPNEVRLAWRSQEDAFAYEVARLGPPEDLRDDPNMQRYCFGQDLERVRVQPALPDRPVVSKPEKPLYIFAGEQVTLYLSFPLWLSIEAGAPARRLLEVPTLRLSDTWSGPSTQEGGLCYASRNFGRLAVDEIGARPYRVLTAVHLQNQALEPLCVERIIVPLPHMSLFQDAAGVMWTESLTLAAAEARGPLQPSIGRGPPPEARQAQLVAEPRLCARRSPLARAFGNLLS